MIASRPMARRPVRRAVVVLAVLIVAELAAGSVAIVGLTRGTPAPSTVAARPSSAARQDRAVGELPHENLGTVTPLNPARTAAVRLLLAQRAAAIRDRDRAAFMVTLDPRSPAFRTAQAGVFSNLADVPLAAWSYELDPTRSQQTSGVAAMARYGAAGVWIPDVQLRYELAGFDTKVTRQQQYLTFVRRSGRWYIAADDDLSASGQDSARNLWDFGPVSVVRTADTLVLGHPVSLPVMRALTAVTDAAIPRITAVWGTDWAQRVVVLVPSTQHELSQVLANGSDLNQIAAVATADLAGADGPSGMRVIINPRNYAKLSALGRQIVLTHEMTHVASRAVTSTATPTWLAEGFADYVGYLGSGLSAPQAAGELAADVRGGRLPTALPTDSAFAGASPTIAQAYEQAWLACRLIAARIGQAGLVRFYRRVGAAGPRGTTPGAAVSAALHDQLHLTTAQFTAAWRTWLRRQLVR